ncbi:hypothetical protein PVE_R2G0535 [Pseudomonas veronii 1YdBTEX2]|uniref:Microcin J25-processing protein McjB C-terminal domain-containing protein n=1 Tax=Pseudomonas veronii 1YdBTEX2 TaxID=1295141 RepID=A0A1D3K8P9_PSEVE|nr:hypothetical protein [Pseudomonas sp. AP19]OEC63829.1 hypothetical protein A7D21_28525 [Pseudomonas sp. AP19]SBW84561.1 hypothetical protein PVE_R2G0535 [Pseudomonas veronii 1YdBTEX2]
MLDISAVILKSKLGRTRKDAQVDTCSVFAAALYDFLIDRGIPTKMVTAVKKGLGAWAHAVVEVDGRYFDSLGEFSISTYRDRARIHPSVNIDVSYVPDTRADCFEEEFIEMYNFYLRMLNKAVA